VDELHNTSLFTSLFDTLLPGEQIRDIKPKDNGGKMRGIEVYLNPIEKVSGCYQPRALAYLSYSNT
jgi:hypothetical protein